MAKMEKIMRHEDEKLRVMVQEETNQRIEEAFKLREEVPEVVEKLTEARQIDGVYYSCPWHFNDVWKVFDGPFLEKNGGRKKSNMQC